jgi:hypothetical protein
MQGIDFVQQTGGNGVPVFQCEEHFEAHGSSASRNGKEAQPSASSFALTHATSAAGGAAENNVRKMPRKREKLTAETVLRMFASREDPASCNALATQHGISPKAVRDVWNLRTWRL